MAYKTKIILWSKIGHCPVTNRKGDYCDEVARVEIYTIGPYDALEEARKLIKKTPHAFSGHYSIPEYPNQNVRSRFFS